MIIRKPLLLAPQVEDPPAGGAVGGERSATNAWIENLGPAPEHVFAKRPDEGTKAQGAEKGAAAQQAAAAKDDENRRKAEETAAAAAAAAAEQVAKEKAAAAAQPPPPAAGSETDEDKYPRTGEDWNRFKTARKAERDKLQAEIQARDTHLQEVESKLKELETKVTGAAEPNPEHVAEIERLKGLTAELSDRIIELDVTRDPRFERYFNTKTEEAIGMAKTIVGADRAAQIETILKMPDSTYKEAQIEEFIGNLSELQKIRFGSVMNDMAKLNSEREAEIKKAAEHKEKLVGERKNKGEAIRKRFEDSFTKALADVQDKEKGLAVFQKIEGENSKLWNDQVAARIEKAKNLVFGTNHKPEDLITAALHAVALPTVLQSYSAAMEKWGEEKATLEAQVKELTAAQPGSRGTSTPPAGGKTTISSSEPGMDPMARSTAWRDDMQKQMAALNSVP